MVSQKYRWDFIGLSTDTKPTSETSDKVVNGSTFYCSDTSKLYVYCDGTWYERKALGGGSGGGVTELTSADYNYDYGSTGTNNCIALWLLSEGTYSWATTLRSSVRVTTTETAGDLSADGALVIAASNANLAKVYLYGDGSATTVTGRNILQMYRVNKTKGTSNVSGAAITTRELKQSTGNSESDVMSQNATTSMVFADPSTKRKVQIGNGASATGTTGIAIGSGAYAATSGGVSVGAGAVTSVNNYGTALGASANAGGFSSVAIGCKSTASTAGVVSFGGSMLGTDGYNNSNYRLLTNVYDPQSDHDAATKGYVDPTTDSSAPTTATVGRLGQIQIDTTTATAYMCVAVDDVTPAYTWKKITA